MGTISETNAARQEQRPSQEQAPMLSGLLDGAGALASGACAVHCVLCAFLPGILAAVGVSWIGSDAFEWGATIVAAVFAAAAALAGWRIHQSVHAVSLLGTGIFVLLLARVLEGSVGHTMGSMVGILSGAVLVAGHLSSIRASRLCKPSCRASCGAS